MQFSSVPSLTSTLEPMLVDTTSIPSSRPLAYVPRQVLTAPPLEPEGVEGQPSATTKGAKTKTKRSWRHEYENAAEEGQRDYQPGSGDPDDGSDGGDDGSDDEQEDDPEDDFEPGPVVYGPRVTKETKSQGHVLGNGPEGAPLFFPLPKIPPQLPQPEGAYSGVGSGNSNSNGNSNGNSSSSNFSANGQGGAPSSAVVAGTAAQDVKFGSESNRATKEIKASAPAALQLTAFDTALAHAQAFVGTLNGMRVHQAPEVAEAGWTVPTEPSPGSADMHLIKANSEKREVEPICMRILADTRKLRQPFIELCVARNKHRRITEATTTRESLRDRTQALEAQLRAARRDLKLKHLREDRQV